MLVGLRVYIWPVHCG